MSALPPKADIAAKAPQCPLVTQSGHANPIVGSLQQFAAWEPSTDRAMTTKVYFLLEMIYRQRGKIIRRAGVV
jgi:hypothetical protein